MNESNLFFSLSQLNWKVLFRKDTFNFMQSIQESVQNLRKAMWSFQKTFFPHCLLILSWNFIVSDLFQVPPKINFAYLPKINNFGIIKNG